MCGFCGFISSPEQWRGSEIVKNVIRDMASRIEHRGPDDAGVWVDNDSRIALGHRRLSILDLSSSGHQPMISNNGRFVISYNGEIYNYNEIRQELDSLTHINWRGHSDTEVLLAAIEYWGIKDTVNRCVGMFAFAVYDKIQRVLYLVRDRMGEKPLYYGLHKNVMLFGSELKSLVAYPGFTKEIDRLALSQLLKFMYIPTTYSIYKNISKLPPGTILTIPIDNYKIINEIQPEKYWSVREVAYNGFINQYEGTDNEAIAELHNLLSSSVKGQMISDVPLGAFLSGGIDSSSIVALMQEHSSRPIKTFSIGFHEEGYNEAKFAKDVAGHLNTEHTEMYVTSQDALNVIPKLSSIYDEPFADCSQIPTFLVSQLAKEHVTVSLSGDGGDELFGGYNRYYWSSHIWRRISWMPASLRAVIAWMITALPPDSFNLAFNTLFKILPSKYRFSNPGDKLHKLSEFLAVKSPEEIYINLVSHWKNIPVITDKIDKSKGILIGDDCVDDMPNFESRMMYLDQISYLPDDILAKVDRAGMAVSLESRIPLLDHRVVEFSWSLPLSMKIRNSQGKWLLRQLLYKYVPKELVERPKMGFGVPIDSWLRGPLREWGENLLDETRIKQEGYFNSELIRKKWNEHISGRRNWQYYLWDVLIFQSWLDTNKH